MGNYQWGDVTRPKSDKAAVNELELNGARITNSNEIAEGFNKFFAEIGPELSRDIEEVHTFFDEFDSQASRCFNFQRVTQLDVIVKMVFKKDVEKLVQRLKEGSNTPA